MLDLPAVDPGIQCLEITLLEREYGVNATDCQGSSAVRDLRMASARDMGPYNRSDKPFIVRLIFNFAEIADPESGHLQLPWSRSLTSRRRSG